ncbi:MAG: hypothetical protein H0T84_09165, partial [Tatlockia sp.]|nr:hypothetical protein [Tatlockia sp.]
LSLQTSCEEKIRTAEETLGSHRGYKQIFWDILNVFLSGITLKFFWSNNWRYIEAKTASQEIVDEFCEACKAN